MKPAINIKGSTPKESFAEPFTAKSTRFIANSIDTIEIKDIPSAVLKANFHDICFNRINTSNTIDVIIPLMIASRKIILDGHGISNI